MIPHHFVIVAERPQRLQYTLTFRIVLCIIGAIHTGTSPFSTLVLSQYDELNIDSMNVICSQSAGPLFLRSRGVRRACLGSPVASSLIVRIGWLVEALIPMDATRV